MSPQLSPFRDVGLQHLLENGLNLLQGQLPDSAQKTRVLNGLVEVFSEADRGASTLRSQAALWGRTEAPAFERFSIFFRYLNVTMGKDIPAELSEAKIALDAIQAGQDLSDQAAEHLRQIISLLLEGLYRDRVAEPLRSPLEIKYS